MHNLFKSIVLSAYGNATYLIQYNFNSYNARKNRTECKAKQESKVTVRRTKPFCIVLLRPFNNLSLRLDNDINYVIHASEWPLLKTLSLKLNQNLGLDKG